MKLKIVRSLNSNLPNVDLSNIPFGRIFTDHMFVADYLDGEWVDLRIEPFADFSVSPANMAWHYGQSIFEGMKATKTSEGTPVLFRPMDHAKRFNKSAVRMSMPTFPEKLFVEILQVLVGMEKDWIPTSEGSALYIRPFMFATDEFIGVRPSSSYRICIFMCPVGPYYTKPVSLYAEEKYVRAVEGGPGEAKCAGNYAAALLPAKIAQDKGYDQILWLDAKEKRYVQEVGTMNIFFVIDNNIITPATTGTILKGITRDSVLKILSEKGYHIEQRELTIAEIMDAGRDGRLTEVFGTGTAAVISHVSSITYQDETIELPPLEERVVASFAKSEINGIRAGHIADRHGWLLPAKVMDMAMA